MIRALFRLMYMLFITLWQCLLLAFSMMGKEERARIHLRNHYRAEWARKVCRRLGFDIEIEGQPASEAVMLVGNHRSYLDPVVLMRSIDCTAVMKAEVARWPVIGWAALFSGILTVDRSNAESRKQVLWKMKQMADAACSILIFPEGTSTKAPQLLPFKKGAFEMAAQASMPLQPFALEFAEADMAWVGEETFLPHFFRCFSKPRLKMKLRFGPILRSEDGMQLLQQAHQWVARASADLLDEYAKEQSARTEASVD